MIGYIVSIDVRGLLLSQYKDFSLVLNANKPPKTPFAQAALHAFWHAFLFLIYMVVISGGIAVAGAIVKTFAQFVEPLFRIVAAFLQMPLPRIDTEQITKTFLLLTGLVVILLVWITYSQKLIDKHSERIGETGVVLTSLRGHIRPVYRIIRRLPFIRNLADHALALGVAVDMLAISALIRVFFLGMSDSGFSGWHFRFFSEPNRNIDIPVFAGVIFVVVFLRALAAARESRHTAVAFDPQRLIRLRLQEPLFVFFILAIAIDHLLDAPADSQFAPSAIMKIALNGAIATILTILLISFRGMTNIKNAVTGGIEITIGRLGKRRHGGFARDVQVLVRRTRRFFRRLGNGYTIAEILRQIMELRRWVAHNVLEILMAVIFAFTFMTIFAASHFVGIRQSPLTVFVGYLSFVVGVLSLISLFCPRILRFDPGALELHIDEALARTTRQSERGLQLYSRHLIYCAIAYFSVTLFTHLSFRFQAPLTFGSDEAFLGGLILMGAYVSAVFALVLQRERRQMTAHERRSGPQTADKKFSITFSDIITAIGLISFALTILVTTIF